MILPWLIKEIVLLWIIIGTNIRITLSFRKRIRIGITIMIRIIIRIGIIIRICNR